MVRNRWSDLVCFAGRASGEVLVRGRKVLGISQRRNRFGVWFQCAALLKWSAAEIVDLLDLHPPEEAIRDLKALAAPLGVDRSMLESEFLNRLA